MTAPTQAKDWTPDQIRAAIIRKGTSQSAIARAIGVSPQTVNLIIFGRGTSDRVRRGIAKSLSVNVERIWPSIYVYGEPPRVGKPHTGIADLGTA